MKKETTFVPEQVAIPGHVEFERVDGDFVLMDLKQGLYFGLDSVASLVWESLADDGSVDTAARAVAQRFQAEPETVDRDVRALVGQLLERNLLVSGSDKFSGGVSI